MKGVLRCLTVIGALAAAACGDDGGPTGPDGRADATERCLTDETPPVVASVTASPSVLWPPNHEMVPVAIAVAASDECSDVGSRIVAVTSDEPVDGLGDGHTAPDWIVTGDLELLVRAERSGTGDGRVYTVTIEATDEAGNAAGGSTTIRVPHDQGNRQGATPGATDAARTSSAVIP